MEKKMEAMVEVLEQELEGAFEVKDRKSLHRYVLLLTENVVKKENYERQQLEMRSDIRNLAELTRQGFARMDERFEAVDRRFEAVQKQIDERFEAVQKQMDERFEAVQKQMDERFKAVDRHFDEVNARLADISTRMFHFMVWSFGFSVTLAGVVIGVLKFL